MGVFYLSGVSPSLCLQWGHSGERECSASVSFVYTIPRIIHSVSKCPRENLIRFGIKAVCRFYITSRIYLRLLYFLLISPSPALAVPRVQSRQLQVLLLRDAAFNGEKTQNFLFSIVAYLTFLILIQLCCVLGRKCV